ncbi:MAG: Glycosyltransferase [uncultured Acidimicrobiales bacterium]|uniref:Glycosyltransferase n=1 Tax=uncultured Acidimicrobiales bacterium TaxID=310071 RepID=A0A6J4H672_9ACTN|nr:MAG: Glycosyltransferase [uncultured Acidimicrobiales bacterium]
MSELVVLSHLRWDWVWQRPQHLVSRLGEGLPTWFVEEPMPVPGLPAPSMHVEPSGGVNRAWLKVDHDGHWIGFGDLLARDYGDRLVDLLPPQPGRVVWLYTAAALPLAMRLDPSVLVYDVMDDLSSFKGAVPEHRLRHQAALKAADVVFTGGRSLHRGVTAFRHKDVHCFPSGVEPEHYAEASHLRPESRPRPVAGYVGVIDERIDLDLVAAIADALPDWDVEMVGPVAKIDLATLPTRPNLRWCDARPYAELPAVMAGFDVALMPFALNEATRSISPTKTLEYLAAGLPVASTRVPDVVADYGTVVALCDDGPGFALACRSAWANRPVGVPPVHPVVKAQNWDRIADRMAAAVVAAPAGAVETQGRSARDV